MKLVIRAATLVNEGMAYQADVLVEDGRISRIEKQGLGNMGGQEINAEGLHLMPGVIDDQVHFREPGLTHKADIGTESRAAVAGGTTSFMEMPNTIPAALTQQLLQEKYEIAAKTSPANYSFFMGTGLNNYDELMRTNPKEVCGIKIFMGSSTGEMLVDDPMVLERIFANSPCLIATHCEDDKLVRQRLELYKHQFGENILPKHHPEIRNEEVCLNSSSYAVAMAKKFGTRLHVLHISTADELALFDHSLPLAQKKITAEVCVHHLWFSASDYEQLGNYIKCNPAIKEAHHKIELFKAMLDNRLDIIATDHAPHTLEEKGNSYSTAPSGLPLVQHSLLMMLEFYKQGRISLERVVEKMCHAPATCFQVSQRGFLREGYYADMVLVDLDKKYIVSKENILYKCGWSPLEKYTFSSAVHSTFVNGNKVYADGKIIEGSTGQRLLFERN
jgi:dihydroorotase